VFAVVVESLNSEHGEITIQRLNFGFGRRVRHIRFLSFGGGLKLADPV
jgi:hypothetical protein